MFRENLRIKNLNEGKESSSNWNFFFGIGKNFTIPLFICNLELINLLTITIEGRIEITLNFVEDDEDGVEMVVFHGGSTLNSRQSGNNNSQSSKGSSSHLISSSASKDLLRSRANKEVLLHDSPVSPPRLKEAGVDCTRSDNVAR